jgi:DNA-binding MarR family transcriptional regulator
MLCIATNKAFAMHTPAPTETPSPARQMRELVRLYLIQQRRAAHAQDLPPQGRLLILIQKHGPLTQAEFGRIAGMEKSWVSRAVDRLVAAGWVERQPLESDRRCLQLYLTPAGEALAREVDQRMTANAEQLFATLSAAEQTSVSTALSLLLTALTANPKEA